MAEKIECESLSECKAYPVRVRVVTGGQIRVTGEERGRQSVWVRRED